jgi:hypothetical protein
VRIARELERVADGQAWSARGRAPDQTVPKARAASPRSPGAAT